VERLGVSLRKLEAPDHSVARVCADGAAMISIPIVGGSGKYDEESPDPARFPALRAGQTIEVTIDGKLVLSGELTPD